MTQTINVKNLALFYLGRLLETGQLKMTLTDLQADINIVNALLDAIASVFPNQTGNAVITFLKQVDSNPILQNIILLVVNDFAPADQTNTIQANRN